MAGKAVVTAWKSAAVDNTPMVEGDGDVFKPLRQLADKYHAKAEYLAKLALGHAKQNAVEGARDFYRRAEASVRALIPNRFEDLLDDFPIIGGAPADILDDVHSNV